MSWTSRRLAVLFSGTMVLAACVNSSGPEVTEPTDMAVTTTAASTTTDSTVVASEFLRVALVLPNPVADRGWSWAHAQGAQHVQEQLGDAVQITTLESIAEGPTSKAVFERIAEEGHTLIFGAGAGYMDSMVDAALNHPDVTFVNAMGTATGTNLGTYSGAAEEGRYLSGMVAGDATESNIIGYVAAFPIPDVVRGINAFTLGAQEVNPDVEVRVVWTETWFDPPVEGQATQAVLDEGADVVAMHQNSAAVGLTAASAGAKWVGNNTDMSEFAPDAWLTAPIWSWEDFYHVTVQSVISGTWVADDFYGTMSDGTVDIAAFGSSVPGEIRTLVEARQQAIIDGTFSVFPITIVDQDGLERPLGNILTMDFFVAGVIGDPSG